MEQKMDHSFQYRGGQFVLSIVPAGPDLFQAHVLYEHGLAGLERCALPLDGDPYASPEEAWRHAEQQAVRWVHDRCGDGRAQF